MGENNISVSIETIKLAKDVMGKLSKKLSQKHRIIIRNDKKTEIKEEEYSRKGLQEVIFSKVETIGRGAFEDCKSLEVVTIPLVKTIAEFTFNGCISLNTIEIPQVTYIKTKAFMGCETLKEIEIPEVISIGINAFIGCEALTEIKLPKVETIMSEAFMLCQSLTTIEIPKIVCIGNNAFLECTSLTTIKVETKDQCETVYNSLDDNNKKRYNDGKLSIIYKENKKENKKDINFLDSNIINNDIITEIKLKEHIKENIISVTCPNVEKIGKEAFRDCTELIEVHVVAVKNIGSGAFKNCKLLKTIEVPLVQTLEKETFKGCTSLTKIELPSVTKIDCDTFSGCKNLTTINIPKINQIEHAFAGCDELRNIYVENEEQCETIYCSELNEENMEKLKKGELNIYYGNQKIKYEPKENIIPEDGIIKDSEKTKIATLEYSYKNKLKEAIFYNVKYVKELAFKECSNLEEISMPLATDIGRYAFSKCISLKTIKIPKINNLGIDIFKDCCKIDNIYVNNKYQCENIFCLALDNENKKRFISGELNLYYGENEFYKFEIEDLQEKFVEPGKLDNNKAKVIIRKYEKSNTIESVSFREAERIEDCAFRYCLKLKEVLIPLVTSIGKYAFFRCKTLEKIELPLVTSMGKHVFEDCELLTNIDIPLIECIDKNTFYGCKLLSTVKIPSARIIKEKAFSGCTSLKTIELPLVENIEENAFYNCRITEINIPAIKNVEKNAFFGLPLLKKINVSTIEQSKMIYDILDYKDKEKYKEKKLGIFYINKNGEELRYASE